MHMKVSKYLENISFLFYMMLYNFFFSLFIDK